VGAGEHPREGAAGRGEEHDRRGPGGGQRQQRRAGEGDGGMAGLNEITSFN
jgi:hypothetical protein